jgi:hypothetical protein
MSPRSGSTPRLVDWLTDRQSQCDFDFELQRVVSSSAEWSDVKYLAGEWESSVVSWQLKISQWREDQEAGVKWPPAWDPVSWVVSWQEFYTGGWEKRIWGLTILTEEFPVLLCCTRHVLEVRHSSFLPSIPIQRSYSSYLLSLLCTVRQFRRNLLHPSSGESLSHWSLKQYIPPKRW